GFHGLRRPSPPPRHRRDPRLGAGPLPARSARTRLLRWHPPLRARRPAAARASRLGHAHLQLRTPRGRELPARQRALLARPLSRRRAPGRRRRVRALPRLLAQAGRVGAEPVRRAGATRRPPVPPPPRPPPCP